MTFRNRVRIILVALAVMGTGAYMLLQADREKAVKTLLRKGKTAIETENMDRLAPLISLSYRDELGLGYAALRGGFDYVFSQFSDITVDYRVTGITTSNDTVIADLAVWGRGTWMETTQDIAGSEDDPVPISILCRKEMLRWKIVGSRWPRGRAGLRQFN